ncbi:fructose-bisphosphate aldolase class I [Leeuwenhoekiella aestuarii]|uniref:Fructose-bisphosphate aldolase n=1 Tax=Leeuwenhoekiella aestuarii TaxID=2249426 RepID=A0A4Q0NWJ3_9FLAO|nr:class I fructose-bisphosphate aldolase [Leeuwenhoekiella aestuarii]RXG11649.1 fructose-bisphosphate aldolase class I [Leeuwenhoekiella aestuarii]RXG15140.1 fructose-bisphosphate aldolase class I [Leeuwenhoekiella aestuarii]
MEKKLDNSYLKETIRLLFAGNKRFEALGIPQTLEMRRNYRELIIKTPGLNESIGGVILYDETIRQRTKDGIKFTQLLKNAGIIFGIKVDTGAKPMAAFPGEKVTEGLDGLRERLAEYKKMDVRFAKWRMVIAIAAEIPTTACIEANIHALVRYAALCQEAEIVPIVEPEILMSGNHTIERCYQISEDVLKRLFYQLYQFGVDLEGMILKPNMVSSGKARVVHSSVDEVAEATIKCLRASVPASVPAIAFLSGGQSSLEAATHLNAMHTQFKNQLPWMLTFSFGRAIQQPALEVWKGRDENIKKAHKLLYLAAKSDVSARLGKYFNEMDRAAF